MKKFLLTFLMLIASVPLWAEDFEVNAISYNIIDETNKTVEVTFNGESYGAYYSGAVSIPSEVSFNGTSYSVTSIGENAFRTSRDLTSVTIGNSVTLIGRGAFNNCPSLTSVTIPNSVTTIRDHAFYKCSSLTDVNISDLSAWCRIIIEGPEANPLNYAHHLKLNGTEVTNLVIPNDVTEINPYAFFGCTGLTSITIPNSVTTIGTGVFSGCTGLTSITIPNSVTTIYASAFTSCSSLTKLNIEDGVESISGLSFPDSPIETLYLGRNTSDAFMQGKTSLKELTIGNTVTTIGENTFSGCTGLTSVTIPNSVTTIGDNAFSGCGLTEVNITDLSAWCKINFNSSDANPLNYAHHLKLNGIEVTNLVIPNDVTEIKPYAFFGCTSLTSITILNSVTTIGTDAFSGCSSLTKLNIEDGVESISGLSFPDSPIETLYLGRNTSDAFMQGKTSLKELTIGNTVTTIGENTFSGCTGLTEVNITDLSAWCKINFNSSDANPLNYAHHLKLNGIEVTNLVIPNDVTEIKPYAFFGCNSLTSITIPNSVTTISAKAFYGCSSLAKLKIEDGVESISGLSFPDSPIETLYLGRNTSDAFMQGKTSLKELTIGNTVTTIGANVFSGCSGLTSVTIPNSVTTIGANAFSGCTGLTEVNITDLSAWCKINFGNSDANPLNYAHHLKLNGTEVTNLVIPNDITEIKQYAFENCTGLTSATIPNSVTSIGYNAFQGCTGLTSVTIPNSVTSIGYSAFRGCTGLTSVTIPNSVTEIGNSVFSGCSGLTSVTIPNSVTSIGWYAFYECTGLTSVTIPNSVTGIGNSVFSGCSGLTEITIPNSVTGIGNSVFSGCI